MCVFFSLASILLWARFLEKPGFTSLIFSLLAALAAGGFKQSGVNIIPWMIILQLRLKGPRSFLEKRILLAWIPFLVWAGIIIYIGVTVGSGVGEKVAQFNILVLIDRLLRSIGHMVLPINFRPHRKGLELIALSLIFIPLLASLALKHIYKSDTPRPALPGTFITCIAMLAAGHASVLPIEPEIIGGRCYYEPAPGFALVLASIFSMGILVFRSRVLKVVPFLALVSWIGINVYSIHNIEKWKFDAECRRIERLKEQTCMSIKGLQEKKDILFLDPPMRDIRDFKLSKNPLPAVDDFSIGFKNKAFLHTARNLDLNRNIFVI